MEKTDTKTLIEAMRILARNIYSEDGVASAAISEAADRLEEMRVQHRKDDDEYAKLWQMYGDLEEQRDRLQQALIETLECYNGTGELSDIVWDEARAALKDVDDGR